MVTFRNNNGRRNTFREMKEISSNNERNKFNNNFSNSENFQRKAPGRNNHNASKLIDKYNNFRGFISGDKILSENYFQHADHLQEFLTKRDPKKQFLKTRFLPIVI